MASPRRSPSTLSGLVSEEAELLYNRLRFSRSMPGPQFDDQGAPARELSARGLVFRSSDGESVRPVEATTALRVLLDDEQMRLTEAHQRIMTGWDHLMSLLPNAVLSGPQEPIDGVQVLTDPDEIAGKAATLYAAPKKRLRGTETGEFRPRTSKDEPRIQRASVQYRMIYQADCVLSGRSTPNLRAAVGEQVRLCAKVPIKMVHVDDAVALVALDKTAGTALLVRAPALLGILAEWFDLLWTGPATLRHSPMAEVPELPAGALDVLSMMPFDDDETIARKMRVSVSTVRRKIRMVYQALDVDNRFAAGMVAAKRGWI